MPKRALAAIQTDIDALKAADKKNPRKMGQLKDERYEALEAENADLRSNTQTVTATAGGPEYMGGIDWASNATPTTSVSTDSELLDRIIVEYSATERRSTNWRIFWNRLRTALRIRHKFAEEAGVVIPGERINLPVFDTLGIDDQGEDVEAKPEPIPALTTAFETAVAAEERVAEESASKEANKADRISRAMSDVKRGQLGEQTAEKAAKAARDAQLIASGAGGGMPSL